MPNKQVRENEDMNNEITVAECPYCSQPKQVKVWDKTGEKVCLDCRRSLLEQEFEDADRI